MSQKSNPTPASLRECPFCGGHAVLEEYTVRKGFEAQVVCNGWCPDSHVRTITYETQAEANAVATTRWNTRPEPPAVRCAGNEELREALTEAIQAMKLASSTLIHANKHGLGTVPLADNLWTKAELLEAALAPVPQPPAGNEEPASMEAGSADAAEAVFHWAWVWRKKPSPETCADLVKACRNFIGDTQPAPATGTDCGWQSIEQAYSVGALAMAHYYHGEHARDEFKADHAGRAMRPEHIEWAKANAHLLPACNGTGKATACPHRCDEGKVYVSAERKSWKPCPLHGHGKREDR